MQLGKYSLGIGDRFGLQGTAQLMAFKMALENGMEIIPVWNKSFREHLLVGTNPGDVRHEAENAVKSIRWELPYFVDADHINLKSVDSFLTHSDFFTIDVAEFIGTIPDIEVIDSFVKKNSRYLGPVFVPGLDRPINISKDFLAKISGKFSVAATEAGKIYRKIEEHRGAGNFITEVSMDEVDLPQSPEELFFILGLLNDAGVNVDTIAPRFTGSFHKGIDYSGNISSFTEEFEKDLLIIEYARKEFGIRKEIKLSIHSGSDKFSLYPVINRLIRKHEKGIHLKTAGTTWLEEIAGVILSGQIGFDFGLALYKEASSRYEELLKPYAQVTDINHENLPDPGIIKSWGKEKLAQSIIHDQSNTDYNSDLRQFFHLSYKIAAERFGDYRELVIQNQDVIAKRVTENIFKNHIRPLFMNRS
jgi:tagaturonate epimerase